MMFRRIRKLIFALALLLYIPIAYSFDYNNFELSDGLEMIGKLIFDIAKNEYILFGIIVILLIILFRSIFMASLQKIPSFGNTRYSSAVATSLAILCVMGFIYIKMRTGKNIHGILEGILGPSGLYLGVIFSVMTFLWLRHSMNNSRFAYPLGGLVLYAVGSMLNIPFLMGIGSLITFFSLFYAFIGSRFGSSGSSGNFGGNTRNSRRNESGSGSSTNDSEARRNERRRLDDERAELELEEKNLKTEQDFDETENKVNYLENLERKLEKGETLLIHQEKEGLDNLTGEEKAIKKIDNELRIESERWKNSDDAEKREISDRIEDLRKKRQEYLLLYRTLVQKLNEELKKDHSANNEILKYEQKEKEYVDKEIDDIRKEIELEEKEIDKERHIIISLRLPEGSIEKKEKLSEWIDELDSQIERDLRINLEDNIKELIKEIKKLQDLNTQVYQNVFGNNIDIIHARDLMEQKEKLEEEIILLFKRGDSIRKEIKELVSKKRAYQIMKEKIKVAPPPGFGISGL